jgi:hypothetical protein
VGGGTFSKMYDVALAGDYAYCGMRHGLMIVDVSDPYASMIVALVDVADGCAYGVAVSADHVHLPQQKGILSQVMVTRVVAIAYYAIQEGRVRPGGRCAILRSVAARQRM